MTCGQELEQQGFIIGYLASYATEYAAEAALKANNEEFKANFLENTPGTPFPELLQRGLQKGVEEAVVTLLKEEKISPEAISKAMGCDLPPQIGSK
ncbi:MAG: hypothetical protein ROO73_02905 [Roseivirga sp.]